jgi:hypothetical protein
VQTSAMISYLVEPDQKIKVIYTTRPDYVQGEITMLASEYAYWMQANKASIAWAVIEATKGE